MATLLDSTNYQKLQANLRAASLKEKEFSKLTVLQKKIQAYRNVISLLTQEHFQATYKADMEFAQLIQEDLSKLFNAKNEKVITERAYKKCVALLFEGKIIRIKFNGNGIVEALSKKGVVFIDSKGVITLEDPIEYDIPV